MAKLLEDYGQRVQYSVFECRLEEKIFSKMVSELELYAADGDSIRVYQICENCLAKKMTLGNPDIQQEDKKFFIV